MKEDSQETRIAAEALRALRLHRLREHGDLTHQEYLDRLNLRRNAVPAEPAAEQTGSEIPIIPEQPPAHRASQALHVLHLRRLLDEGRITRQDYLDGLNTTEQEQLTSEPQASPVAPAADAETVPPARPESEILTSQPARERFLIMKCPKCGADQNIYDDTDEFWCAACDADILVERRDCTIALHAEEEQPSPDLEAEVAAATLAANNAELSKLKAEAAMINRVKRSAGFLGGACGSVFSYIGITDLMARHMAMGTAVLVCGSALLLCVFFICKHTANVGKNLKRRIRAITEGDPGRLADSPV